MCHLVGNVSVVLYGICGLYIYLPTSDLINSFLDTGVVGLSFNLLFFFFFLFLRVLTIKKMHTHQSNSLPKSAKF